MREDERVKAEDGAVVFAVKTVPGARREAVAGWLGDRLKVRVSQLAEGGKANRALLALLAAELGVEERAVELVRGEASAEKVVRVRGVSREQVLGRWP